MAAMATSAQITNIPPAPILKGGMRKEFDLYNFQYRKPIKKDLAICFMYFNAAKSKRILMNYLYCVEKLKVAEIPTFTIEMYETVPEIKDAFHVKTDCILFQKERMAHILERHVPKSYTKLACIDADLVFENINWYNELSAKLDRFDAVHVFTKFVRLDITYTKLIDECFSFIFKKKFGNVQKVGKIGFNPGGGWGFQRAWFNRVGFFQDDILGGSDTYSVQSWGIIPDEYVYPRFIQNSIKEYKAKVGKDLPSVSYLKGNVYHLWHGGTDKKQYRTRKNILRSVKDVRDIVSIERNGLFRLKKGGLRNTTIRKRICKFFKMRDDDGAS